MGQDWLHGGLKPALVSSENHQKHHLQYVGRWAEYGTEAELPDPRVESRGRRSGQGVPEALKSSLPCGGLEGAAEPASSDG